MALTGFALKKYFDFKYDSAYSGGWLDTVKANRLLRETQLISTDKKYLTLDEQKIFDELTHQITTQNVFPINNNRIFTSPIAITNIIFAAGFATITTLYPHNLITGDTVTLSAVLDVLIVPNINTTWVATVLTPTTFTIPYNNAGGTYTANSGQVVFNKLIPDYMHLYSVKCKYTEPQLGLQVNSTSGTSPIIISFPVRTKFRDSSIIQLTSMTLLPAANGTWYWKTYTTTSGALYTDADLIVPSIGGIATTGNQGAINYIWYNEAKPKFADRYIDPFEVATPDSPQFETADKFLKFYPDNRVCTEATISYFKIPTVFIDTADDIYDLSLTYPERYLYFITDVAIRLLSTPLRDQLLNNMINQEIQVMP